MPSGFLVCTHSPNTFPATQLHLFHLLTVRNKEKEPSGRKKWSWRKSICMFIYRILRGRSSVTRTWIYPSTFRGITRNPEPKIIVFQTGRKNEISGERHFLSLCVSFLARSMFIYGLRGHTRPALGSYESLVLHFFMWLIGYKRLGYDLPLRKMLSRQIRGKYETRGGYCGGNMPLPCSLLFPLSSSLACFS